jgi:hypothetical protein
MIRAIFCVGLLSVFFSLSLHGQETAKRNYLTAEIANDVFFLPLKTDRYFTSGMQFEFGSVNEEKVPLSDQLIVAKSKYWRINHDLFTPSAIDSTSLMRDDRPFASYLTLSRGRSFTLPGKAFYFRRQWTAGILGKYSGGGMMQNAFHSVIDFAEEIPGWTHEVKTDVVLNYELELGRRFFLGKHSYLSVNVLGRLGTLYTDLRPEATLSLMPLHLQKDKYLQLEFSAASRWVGYNATLSGGLFNRDDRYRGVVMPHRLVHNLGVTGHIQFSKFYLRSGVKYLTPEFWGGQNHVWAWIGFGVR